MQLEPSDEAETWVPVNFLSRSPGSRVFPSAAVHGDSLYVFGGHDGTVYRNDLLIFNLDTRTWELDLVVAGEGPSPRDAHAAVVHAEWMYVFGGYDSKRYLNDFHRFHFDDVTWSVVPFAAGSAPSPRGGHTAVVHGASMFVFGGCDGWNYFNDLYSFSFPGREWAPVRVTGTAPGARSAPATVVHAEQGVMYVFGGYDGARSLNGVHHTSTPAPMHLLCAYCLPTMHRPLPLRLRHLGVGAGARQRLAPLAPRRAHRRGPR